MAKFEIYGLFEDQIKSLSEKFGDAVLDINEERDTMILELSDMEAEHMVHDGYSLK